MDDLVKILVWNTGKWLVVQGNQPLIEPVLTEIYVARPQWVQVWFINTISFIQDTGSLDNL